MVNFKALEAAVTKIESIRDHEFCFEVDGTKICLRPLRPDQETEVQRYAQLAMEDVKDGDPNQAAFADFMDKLRHASLAFSIVQIGPLNLRDVDFIETEKVDDHGKLISIPKWEAITDLVSREWSRLMLAQVFGKFGEMLDRLELRAQKAVSFDPVDLDEEIERTTRRLKDLQEAKSRIKAPQPGGMALQQQAVAKIDKATEESRNEIRQGFQTLEHPRTEEVVDEGEESEEGGEESEEGGDRQVSSSPPSGRVSAVPVASSPRERQVMPSQKPSEGSTESPMFDKNGIMLPENGDSFFDPADPGQAVEIESRRQALLQQQHLSRQQAKVKEEEMRREMGIPTSQEYAQQMMENQRQANRPKAVDLSGSSPGRAVDSVRDAANLHNAVVDARGEAVRSGRPQRARPQGREKLGESALPAQLHGKPVYKMPTQTLDRPEVQRQHGDPAPGPVQMNPSAGGRNPNFRPKGT